MTESTRKSNIDLPPTGTPPQNSLRRAIADRRSVRDYTDQPLSLEQISQLCWAGCGVTDPVQRLRAAPSAGGLYPVTLYLATPDGVTRYLPDQHGLKRHRAGDVRPGLRSAALDQEMITQAPLTFTIAAAVNRTASRYGDRAWKYCLLEAGHIAQNILLQAAALGLGGVPIGAFEEDDVASLLGLPESQQALYMLVIGHPRRH